MADLGKQRKNFEKWQYAKAPISANKIQVPELKDLPAYQFGLITVPLKSGQQVKAFYLQTLYEAAVLLGLHLPPVEGDPQEEDLEDEDLEDEE